jgi:putative transposase
MISAAWTEHWEQVVPFLAFSPGRPTRRLTRPTRSRRSTARSARSSRPAAASPQEDSARKLLYLAITRAQRKWRHTYNWTSALTAFRIHFGDRISDTAI